MGADDVREFKIIKAVSVWPDLWPPLGQRRRVQRKRRTPSIRTLEKNTGKTVRAVTYGTDGSKTYTFGGESDTTPDNPWDAEIQKIQKASKQK
jgi:hypothetical protein